MTGHRLRLAEVNRARLRLERDGFPRVQMLFLVMLTGAAGFLASYLMLQAGVHQMWLRYLGAVCIAYLVFLLLLWLWLRTSAEDYADLPNLASGGPDVDHGSGAARCADTAPFTGKGGEADGGGASGWFDTPDGTPVTAEPHGAVGEALGAAAEAEELAIPLVVLVLVGAALLSSLLVVYSAPLLFAELLVDGVLAASLYKRLRRIERRHWLETAVRRTLLPFALTAAFAASAGFAMAVYAPGAISIGGVFLAVR